MKKSTTAIAILMALYSIGTNAQQREEQPHGKAIVQIYTNFHSGFGASNHDRGFELERSYIGYEYMFSRNLTVKGVLDIGRSDDVQDYQRIAYIKNAMLSWNYRNMTLDAGLIGTTQFSLQEKFWGLRYVYRTFQDKYAFGNSADLGVSVRFKPFKWFEADAIIANGEGFKRVQKGDGLMYGAGTTIMPFKGMYLRLYAGLNENKDDKSDIINYSMFGGYENRWFSLALEYNIIRNFQGTKGNNRYGFSLYGSISPNSWLRLYARSDGLMSNNELSKEAEELVILAGAEFKIGKYVRIAPSFRAIIPKEDNIENGYYGYISCSFGL